TGAASIPKTAAERTQDSMPRRIAKGRPKQSLPESQRKTAPEAPAPSGRLQFLPSCQWLRLSRIFKRAPGAIVFPRRLFQDLIFATVVSKSCAIEESVSPRRTR